MNQDELIKEIVRYDGGSLLCSYWVQYWQRSDDAAIEYRHLTEEDREAYHIDASNPDCAFVYASPEGKISSGADAVVSIIERIGPGSFWAYLYRRLPFFAVLFRSGYRLFMRHSTAGYRCACFFWGKEPIPARYALVSWLFLRILGALYIGAFASMAFQIEGLVGSSGILPIADRLELIRDSIGVKAYFLFPSLFWLDASDSVLTGVCIWGLIGGVAVFFNLFTRAALIVCYVLYLSIYHAGQDFTSFQWDLFLLEAGFLAIFLCSGSVIIVFLYRWLIFRFMFLGGLVKIASGDPTWRDLTALTYHYETQPLPSPVAWYAHQLPLWFQQVSVAGVLVIELIIPFLVFMPRRLRLFAAWSFILLQCGIILTGNYNFFNLLTIAICLFLFDDASISRLFGLRTARNILSQTPKPGSGATVSGAVLAATVLLSNATLAWASNSREAPPEPFYGLMRTTLILGIANTYGPFAVMTTRRGEIEIEASMNGRDWLPYEFKYKPGELDKQLVWLIPHQPRLDWQMWFAALRPGNPPYWFGRLMDKLKSGDSAVDSLFQKVPFPKQAPRYLRAKFYQYRFTNPEQRESMGRIWSREYLGLYLPTRRFE